MVSKRTKFKRKNLGSPIFSKKNSSTITSGGMTILDFDKRATRESKYAPFNDITILNNSGEVIKVYINQDEGAGFLIPSNTIQNFAKDEIPAFNSIKIENAGTGNISADEISVNVQRTIIDGNSVIKSVAKKLFGV